MVALSSSFLLPCGTVFRLRRASGRLRQAGYRKIATHASTLASSAPVPTPPMT